MNQRHDTAAPDTQRARMLEVATAAIARDGYLATEIDIVAAEAGVDPGVFRAQFGSKEGLFTAIISQVTDRLVVPLPRPELESLITSGVDTFLHGHAPRNEAA